MFIGFATEKTKPASESFGGNQGNLKKTLAGGLVPIFGMQM